MVLSRSRSVEPKGASRSNAARATSRWSVLTAAATSSSRVSSLARAASRTARCTERRATAPIAFCSSSRSRAERLTDSTRAARATSPRSRASDSPASADSPASGSAAPTAVARSIAAASSRTCGSASDRAMRPIADGLDSRITAASLTVGSASSDAIASNRSWASSSSSSTAEARTDGSSCRQSGWPRNRSSRLMRQRGAVHARLTGPADCRSRPRRHWTAPTGIMHTWGQFRRTAVRGRGGRGDRLPARRSSPGRFVGTGSLADRPRHSTARTVGAGGCGCRQFTCLD